MRVVGISNKGLKKEINEDCYSIDENVFYDKNSEVETFSVISICDGVSNSNEAKNASNFVCSEIANDYLELLGKSDSYIANNIDKINDRLVKNYKDSATTVALITMDKDDVKAINVGDTKIYSLKDGKIEKLSIDDTYYEYLKSIGDLSYHNYKNSHIITACLGNKNLIKKVIHINTIKNDFKKGDYLVLCSDGVSDMIGDSKLEYFLSMKEALEVKVDKIEKRILFRGARDNYTIVVVEF